jgi:aspartate/methionine/tyrosine aminotransferase
MHSRIADFKLKQFFNSEAAHKARTNLSSSYAELLTLPELLALEPAAMERFTQLPLGYTNLNGGLELRSLIAARYSSVSADDVMVTAGSDDALALLICALLETGDHMVAQCPAYQPTTALAEWAGASVSSWWANEQQRWEPPLHQLERLLKPRTRMVIVTLPHNPTGFSFNRKTLLEVISLVDARQAVLISDEVYRDLSFDPADDSPHAADLSSKAVAVGSLTKTFGLPGLRVGWIASRNREALDKVRRLRMHFNGYLPAPSEFLAAVALRNANAILARNLAIVRANVAEFQAFLDRRSKYFLCHVPHAGVVAFPRWLGPGTTTELSDRLLKSHGLLLAPSECFDAGRQHVRIGYGTRLFGAALNTLESCL